MRRRAASLSNQSVAVIPGVAELADAADSKSAGDHSPCGFDSLLRDQHFKTEWRQTRAIAQRRTPECSEWQAFEDDLWNPFDSKHNVAPDSWRVEDVRGTALEAPDDVASHLLRIGEV